MSKVFAVFFIFSISAVDLMKSVQRFLVPLFLCALVASEVYASPQNSLYSSCNELLARIGKQSSSSTTVYINLLKALIQNKNAFSANEISLLISLPHAVNPFDIINIRLPLEQTFAFRNVFDKVLKRSIEPLDWKTIQEEMKILSGQKEIKEAVRVEAKTETTEIPYPFPDFWFPSRYKGNQGSPFGLGFWNEKPVLAGHFRDSKAPKSKDDEFMIDPISRKVIRLAGKSAEGRPSAPPRYLNYKGKDYFYRLGYSNKFYNLDLKKNVILKFFNLEVPEGLFQKTGFIYDDGDDIKAVRLLTMSKVIRGSTTRYYKLVLSNLTNPSVKSKTLKTFKGYGIDDFGFDIVDGHPIVSYVHSNSGNIFFYDLKAKQPFPLLSADLYGMGDDHNYAGVFRDGGGIKAVFPVIGGYALANVENGQIVKTLKVSGDRSSNHDRIRVTSTSDGLLAYTSVRDGLLLIDLKNKSLKIIDAKEISSGVDEFVFKDRKYLVWGTSNGSIEIFDPVQETIVSSQKVVTDSIYQVLPYELNGRNYALIAQWNDSPQIIQLAGPVK